MRSTLENILELLERGDVYLASEDHAHFIHLVHDHHRCFIKSECLPEREMNMSDDLIVKILLNAELISGEEYRSICS